MTRYLTIAAIALILLGIGAGMYFFFFTGSSTVIVSPQGSSGLPAAGQGEPFVGEQNGEGGLSGQPGVPNPVSSRLVRISVGPIASGEAVVNIPATNASSSTEISVNYIERQSGNVFSYLVRGGTITRTSNRTVPGIESASWHPSGALAFVRYLSGNDFSTINTYGLPSNGSIGFFLAQNLADIAVSSTSILTLASGVNGSVASLSRTDGSRPSEIFTTPLSSLRIGFLGKSSYLAFTKPSSSLPGYAFIVDGAGRFSSIAGPLSGLVARPSPQGKWILISSISGDTMQMQLVNVASREITLLPLGTIADKCVWKNDDSAIYCGVPVNPPRGYAYPDDWYQGAVHFSDRVWKIDVASRYAQLVLDFSEEAGDSVLDAEARALDPLATTLVFLNRNDGSLWSFSL